MEITIKAHGTTSDIVADGVVVGRLTPLGGAERAVEIWAWGTGTYVDTVRTRAEVEEAVRNARDGK